MSDILLNAKGVHDAMESAVKAEKERKAKAAMNGYDHDAFPSNPDPLWPQPLGVAAYHGITGDFVRLIEPQSESDAAALLFQFIAYTGSCLSDKAWMEVEDTRHYTNVYEVIVGPTAAGRKGTSLQRVSRVFREAAPMWTDDCISSGLSTGEGLIAALRDPTYELNKKTGEREIINPGVSDKRLLVVEQEFSRTLRVIERPASTLPAILRQGWDGETLRIMTRETPLKASNAKVSILGQITIPELKAELTDINAANGFGNRFLWALVKRSKRLPFGGEIDAAPHAQIVEQLKSAIKNCPVGRINFDAAARELWVEHYDSLTEEHPGLYGCMIARAAPQVLRVALIYALLDEQNQIGAAHLTAALEVIRYSNDSVRYIFGDMTGDHIADTILNALRATPDGMSRSDISALFGRHANSDNIGKARDLLLRLGKIRLKSNSTAGRPAEGWHATP